MAGRLRIDVRAAPTACDVVRDADVIVATTPAAPILMAGWLEPGQHVTAMGSDQPGEAEPDPARLARADAYIPDRPSQAREPGERRAALAVGIVQDGDHTELGDVIGGTAQGRTPDAAITIADLTGTGAQDAAIAALALARAEAAGARTPFEI